MAILIGLLLAGIVRSRSVANRIVCASNLRQQGVALQKFEQVNNRLPSGGVATEGGVFILPLPLRTLPGTLPQGPLTKSWGWQAQILPYVGQEDLHTLLISNDPQIADECRSEVINPYLCPSSPVGPTMNNTVFSGVGIFGRTDYAANGGSRAFCGGVNPQCCDGRGGWLVEAGAPPVRWSDARGDLSEKFLIGEKFRIPDRESYGVQVPGDNRGWWAPVAKGDCSSSRPFFENVRSIAMREGDPVGRSDFGSNFETFGTPEDRALGFGSFHPTPGGNFLYADGSVRFVPSETDGQVLDEQAMFFSGLPRHLSPRTGQ